MTREKNSTILCFHHRLPFVKRGDDMVCPICASEQVDRILAGRYHLSKRIGWTGLEELFIAERLATEETVLVGIAREEVMRDAESFRRFEAPWRLRAMVRHPNVFATYEVDCDEHGVVFHVDELTQGSPLDTLLEERGYRLPLSEVLALAWQMATGLDAIHAVGIVHRDIKPGWFTICEGAHGDNVVKLEISHEALGPDGLTGVTVEPGQIVGTCAYLSPEEALSEPGDRRSDLYSFGMTMYRMLAGVVPFDDDNLAQALIRRMRDPLPTLRELAPDLDIPEGFERALRKLADRDPEKRPSSAIEAVEAMAIDGEVFDG